jgi:hypothetical protein
MACGHVRRFGIEEGYPYLERSCAASCRYLEIQGKESGQVPAEES